MQRIWPLNCVQKNFEMHAIDISRVTYPDKRIVTTNVSVCEAFRAYFQDLFTSEPRLSPAQFDGY